MDKLRTEQKTVQTENGEMNLRYVLLGDDSEFKIFAETEKDAAIASCNCGAEKAQKMLDVIIENSVTPTTLSDVLRDFQTT